MFIVDLHLKVLYFPRKKSDRLKKISGSILNELVEIHCIIQKFSRSVIATSLIQLAVFLYTSKKTKSKDYSRQQRKISYIFLKNTRGLKEINVNKIKDNIKQDNF